LTSRPSGSSRAHRTRRLPASDACLVKRCPARPGRSRSESSVPNRARSGDVRHDRQWSRHGGPGGEFRRSASGLYLSGRARPGRRDFAMDVFGHWESHPGSGKRERSNISNADNKILTQRLGGRRASALASAPVAISLTGGHTDESSGCKPGQRLSGKGCVKRANLALLIWFEFCGARRSWWAQPRRKSSRMSLTPKFRLSWAR
jgi:hypothetical protein